eukprot:CAMPEP_0116154598 /NCGR_PEP_ID=MMETSP0329-20121206/21866_1 /TAXON_ID=697910 /ORGANISM="Pseudo-nitzschia arenysensis, Strain B593" /LENGTH=785 /DNA_ID=CAMNT_0003651589 /DNA_START=35 /DNA_END=2392 /DNA_ORIENTATION=-
MSATRESIDSGCDVEKEEIVSNVQVCARIRPLPNNNLKDPKSPTRPSNRRNQKSQNDGASIAWDISADNKSVCQSKDTDKVQGRTHSYTLDRVFGTNSTTDEVYHDSVASLVQRAMQGYNSTVLAYGQTSTGKTHTMTGRRDDPGLIPLCVKDCFRYVRENDSKEPREYLFRFSYLEIYKEHIRDLLSSSTSAPEPVRLFDGPDGLVIRGLKEVVVSSPNKVFQLLKQGDKRRQVGATHMNQQSSRSHVVVQLKIESSYAKNQSGETRVSVLSLVDLAGSESVRLNGTERREEGQYINKSLMTLGQVVLGLSESSKSKGGKKTKNYIPYRDSKLTRLLQSSLSGNAQMLLLCCISPLASHLEESHNTYKFATRAKRIEQKAYIQTAIDKEETLLQTYRNEIEHLKQQLAEAAQQKQDLLEEQRAFQTKMQREREHIEDTEVVLSATPSLSSNIEEVKSSPVEATTGEIAELVEAIQTMEQLILKSQPLDNPQNSNVFLTDSPKLVQDNSPSFDAGESSAQFDRSLYHVPPSHPSDVEKDIDILVENNTIDTVEHLTDDLADAPGAAPTTPQNEHMMRTPIIQGQLHSELTRVRGLLANVLEKRGVASTPRNDPPGIGYLEQEKIRKSLDFSTPSRDALSSRYILDESIAEEAETDVDVNLDVDLDVNTDVNTDVNIDLDLDRVDGETDSDTSEAVDERDAELEKLRKQLKKQERKTSLRKADSHFLQLQLEEKDKLLEDVSGLLEAVEKRQGELERENIALWREITKLREERGEERGILIRNSPF